MRFMMGLNLERIATTFVAGMIALTMQASAFVLRYGQPAALSVSADEQPVVLTAVGLLQGDVQRVLGTSLNIGERDADIVVGTIGGANARRAAKAGVDLSYLEGRQQAFVFAVDGNGRLNIVGSDAAGTAYGIMELTRRLGVSPWEWWADAEPEQRSEFTLGADVVLHESPDVLFRGIFVNDEDWGLLPWAVNTHEPNADHAVGPRTTERIFQLLLRLRANLYWPPMHEATRPFFLTEGNAELASRYGIYIGTSHCEPMACDVVGEWPLRGQGDYNWATNSAAVKAFWERRVAETAHMPMVYTLGMRGQHDGAIQGYSSPDESCAALENIMQTQRSILGQYITKSLYLVPQVFIPYKEVQELYDAGLHVPDDVTLMWTDDNYGYIRHFPNERERARSGGNGVYYHVSYWGRPHDYLWLGTASPFLMFQQLSEAAYHGAARMWVLNVGDIKPSEYQISLFMDMAWSLVSVRDLSVGKHIEEFIAENVGRDIARLSSIYLKEHYQLSFQRKPEHLAGTRVEEPRDGTHDWSSVQDLPWSEKKIRHRLARYDLMQRNVRWLADSVRRTHPSRYDAFFQLVEYPIMCAALQNEKYLCAQLARHGLRYLSRESVQQTWQRSDNAHNRIQQLTTQYNVQRGGKWQGIMNSNPRQLTVFQPVPHKTVSTPLPVDPPTIASFYGASYNSSSFSGGPVLDPVLGLGASIRAMPIPKECNLTYNFAYKFPASQRQVEVIVRLLPTHPIEEWQRFTISLDGSLPQTLAYATHGRSEQWKLNVLQNYAEVRVTLPVTQQGGTHSIVVAALDDGVVVDELFVLKSAGSLMER